MYIHPTAAPVDFWEERMGFANGNQRYLREHCNVQFCSTLALLPVVCVSVCVCVRERVSAFVCVCVCVCV